MNKDLSHLTDIQINELMQRYYDGENVLGLIKEFELKVSSSNLFKLFPSIVYKELFCIYCPNINLIANYKSRTNYNSQRLTSELFCPSCEHENTQYCRCIKCYEIRRAQQEAEDDLKRNIIKESFYNEKIKPPLTANLTLQRYYIFISRSIALHIRGFKIYRAL